ncbi:hypothetical protein [Nonlabens sp. Asnod3-A02]
MSAEKKNCCQGCKKGQPGLNQSCQAKLMMEKLANKPIATEKKAVVK